MSQLSNIGRNVRTYRKLQNWTLRDLERETGIDSGSLSRIENGQGGYKVDTIQKLCTAFGITEGMLSADENPEDRRMIEFRRIPLLGVAHIPAYLADGTNLEVKKYRKYLAVDRSVSRESFAFCPDVEAMRPAFDERDVVVIDPKITPQPGDFVAALIQRKFISFRRYKLTSQFDSDAYELVPLNEFHPVVRSVDAEVELIGTMVEHRRYRLMK